MQTTCTYRAALEASERVSWRVEDIIGGDKQLDFSKPFMPETLAQVQGLPFLTPAEHRTLNQIRGFEYLSMFGLVEEFILPYVVEHVRGQLSGDDYRVRALLRFAGEEAKHIHLFKRFREEFQKGFGSRCEFIGPAEAVRRFVLSHSPLGVALAILHIEWITLRHYVEGVKDNQDLDPQFRSLLKHHWLEESQHTKLDTLIVESLAASAGVKEIDEAFEDYLAIGAFLDDGIKRQAEYNVANFVLAARKDLSPGERAAMTRAMLKGMRWTYLGTGMTHPHFLATVEQINPKARLKIEELAPSFC
ncbi:MAG TPA: hypothetical protein VNL14_20435 [Candidatus Acidoferrales bacterium]|nr:hypothetical protein [Candidatus Acidoferrales bacterium]